MVSFTCDSCQEVVKKNAVMKHYTARCRRATHFSCIDCCKTFDRRSIVYHTNCATEEKYFGPYAKKKNRQHFQHKPQPKGTASSSSSSSSSFSSLQAAEQRATVSSRCVYNNGSSNQDSSGNSSSSNSSTASSRSSKSSCRSTSNVGTLLVSNRDHPAVDGGVGVRSTQLCEKGPLQSHAQEKSHQHLATNSGEMNFSLQKKKQHRQEGKDLTQQGKKVQEEMETSFSEQRQQQHDKRGQKERGSLGLERKERLPATHQQAYLQQQKQQEAKKKEETVAWQGDWLLTVQRLLRTVPQHRLPWKVLAMKVIDETSSPL